MIAISLLLAAFGSLEALSYERGLLLHEPWRLATAHLTHLGMAHLAMNAVGLMLIWMLLGDAMPVGRWLLTVVLSAAGINLGLWLLSPDITWYVGLSGVLHGMWAAAAWTRARARPWSGYVLLSVLILKLAVEQCSPGAGATAMPMGGEVVIEAHLYGALAGLLAGLFPSKGKGPRWPDPPGVIGR
ncbi:rhombosortase [Ectothiorhodospira lacustris]|uniref:rhombosortase n=1 Tax=Ectothiorhodospira lacustris TaxID=2899127 RepID=UPI001EE7D2B5|nr:rhombosortase [Ectothiorhodospira lacustris]MCG5509909.1 rhombosortase [Ectothiorhodospira lacustris]MCG5521163.1 rhombosortase [Ectothiorhodospira lacustris]